MTTAKFETVGFLTELIGIWKIINKITTKQRDLAIDKIVDITGRDREDVFNELIEGSREEMRELQS